VRELAGRREGEDGAVLTRALVALTLRYLWLVRVDDEAERSDRLRRLLRKWAGDRAIATRLASDRYIFAIPKAQMSKERQFAYVLAVHRHNHRVQRQGIAFRSNR
jgi:hypothetical protein